jgi:hypothetical protein
MKTLIAIVASCILFAPGMQAQSNDKPLVSDTEIQLIRSDLQADKHDIIADTMEFTEPESKAFWPVYRNYALDQQKIGDKLVQLIQDYAKQYDNMTDAQAKDMTDRFIKIQEDTLNLKKSYWKKFDKALGPKRTAKFYQVDNRLSLIIMFQLTSEIPLIP